MVLHYLSSLLGAAVADGLIAQNPAQRIRRPRVDRKPVVPFTASEAVGLREAAPSWFRVALTLGLGAGLRQGEATGLTVDRVDFLRRQLTVDRQLLTAAKGGVTFGERALGPRRDRLMLDRDARGPADRAIGVR